MSRFDLRVQAGGTDSRAVPVRRLLAVTAHPDDESFGLGAILSTFGDQGVGCAVLCFTHGESSTLGTGDRDLGVLRQEELLTASAVLGVGDVTLLDYPDGRLLEVPLEQLTVRVLEQAAGADLLLVFDLGGVTGHPDHCRATQAALAAADTLDLPVLAWAIPESVAEQLNAELGTSFVGREEKELDLAMAVDRTRQCEAIDCHHSQSSENPVLWRRLSLLGDTEWLRWLRLPKGQERYLDAGSLQGR